MIIAIDNPTGLLSAIPRMLSVVAGSPTLILLNLVSGAAVVTAGYFASRFARRNWLAWMLGLGGTVAMARLCYFPQYPPGEYYKEAEIHDGEFTHMVLLMMFPLMPLLLLLAYVAGAIRRVGVRG